MLVRHDASDHHARHRARRARGTKHWRRAERRRAVAPARRNARRVRHATRGAVAPQRVGRAVDAAAARLLDVALARRRRTAHKRHRAPIVGTRAIDAVAHVGQIARAERGAARLARRQHAVLRARRRNAVAVLDNVAQPVAGALAAQRAGDRDDVGRAQRRDAVAILVDVARTLFRAANVRDWLEHVERAVR
jgi:hypothetical protein